MKTINGVINLIIGGFLGYLIVFTLMAIIVIGCDAFNIQVNDYLVLIMTRLGSFAGGYISYKYEFFSV